MKLLCITDPRTYAETRTTPELYDQLSRHQSVEFYHALLSSIGPTNSVRVCPVEGDLPYDAFLALDSKAIHVRDISDFDLVFCRTLKPFPEGYVDHLSRLEAHVRFVNRPSSKKRQIQPDFLPRIAADLLPDHIVSQDVAEVVRFSKRFGSIVAKRGNSCGGKGVYKIWQDEAAYKMDNIVEGTRTFDSLEELLDVLFQPEGQPFQFVRFLNHIDAGDKRVLVVDGEIYGGYLKKSSNGHWVHNISAGGTYHATEVGKAEIRAIKKTCSAYHGLGLFTLGYDFLMGSDSTWVLSEINAGNIAGYGIVEELSGEPIYERLIAWLIAFSRREQRKTI